MLDNPVSSSLDLTSDILFISPSNQASNWPNIGDSSPKTTLNPQPSKIKSLTKGKKSPEIPKAAPKRAKKKETEGQATLTSEELTMKREENHKKPKIKNNHNKAMGKEKIRNS